MPLALDFGTCNTVIARWNEAAQRAELLHLSGLGRRYRYRLDGEAGEREAPVVPTLIHYGNGRRRLLGQQVTEEGLVDHPGTFRWVKLDVLANSTVARRVGERRVAPAEAAAEFVRSALTTALAALGDLRDEDLVVTMPVEAFDHYKDWLEDAVRGAFLGRVSLLDEATACILGYQETVRAGDVCLVFDFGGGTLDVAIVKVNPAAEGPRKCQVLGRAGDEIGGSLVDRWLLEELKVATGISAEEVRQVGTRLLLAVEDAKIALSSGEEEADVTQFNDLSGRLISHTFTRKGLAEMLKRRELFRKVAATVKRALDMARDRYGTREGDLRAAFLVGGSSLLLGVRDCVETLLPDTQIHFRDPFGSIAAGACRLVGHQIEAATVHDYGLQSWNRETKVFDFEGVIPKGTPFPTDGVLRAKYIGTAYDNAAELNLVVWERSQVTQRAVSTLVMGPDGRMHETAGTAVQSEALRALNPWAQDFIRPDPPCKREELKRFVVGFGIDAQQRCLVWVKDTRPGNRSQAAMPDGRLVPLPLEAYPLVKLGGKRGGG